MDNFLFIDRPDKQRLKTLKKTYSEIDPIAIQLFIDFQWTYRNMQKKYDSLLEKNELSESRFIILMFLNQSPNKELLPSVISEKLGATRATVSKLLKAMELKQWIIKIPSNSDKRSLSVQLTTHGQQVLKAFLPDNFKIANDLFGNLTNDEIEQLSHLLNKIQTNTKNFKLETE